jgi:hypothetical protein
MSESPSFRIRKHSPRLPMALGRVKSIPVHATVEVRAIQRYVVDIRGLPKALTSFTDLDQDVTT